MKYNEQSFEFRYFWTLINRHSKWYVLNSVAADIEVSHKSTSNWSIFTVGTTGRLKETRRGIITEISISQNWNVYILSNWDIKISFSLLTNVSAYEIVVGQTTVSNQLKFFRICDLSFTHCLIDINYTTWNVQKFIAHVNLKKSFL